MWKRPIERVGISGLWVIAAGLMGGTVVSRAANMPATVATPPAALSPTTNHSPTRVQADLATSAPSTQPQVSVAQMQHWIKELNSHRYSVRHAAAGKLLAAGDAAMPLLKKAMAGLTTPEMRHLLRQDMRKIYNADLLAGPLITLDAKGIPARKAFEMVCKQAGTTANFVNMNQGAMPDVTIHVHKAPFWQVMRQLAILTNVSPAQYNYGNNQPGMPFTQNGTLGHGGVVDVEGGFAIIAQSITYNRSLSLMPGQVQQNQSQFSLQCLVLSIPGNMGPLQIQQAVLSKVVDNHGHSLITANPNNNWYGNQFGNVANLNIPLQWPKNPGTMITELDGYIPTTISMHKKVVDLKFKAKGIAKATIGGVHISISHRRLVNNIWQFTYTIQAVGLNPYAAGSVTQNIVNQLQNLNNGNITFLSAGGKILQNNGWGGGGGGPQGMTYTVNESGGKPAEMRITVYTRSANLKIPLHMKNIPMP